MKQAMVLLFCLLAGQILFTQAFGQDSTHTAKYYLEKSKSQSSTGVALAAGGGGAFVVGVIWAVASTNTSGVSSSATGAGVLLLTGTAAMLASIPFFISAHHNASKALDLSAAFRIQENMGPQPPYNWQQYPGLAVSIRFK